MGLLSLGAPDANGFSAFYDYSVQQVSWTGDAGDKLSWPGLGKTLSIVPAAVGNGYFHVSTTAVLSRVDAFGHSSCPASCVCLSKDPGECDDKNHCTVDSCDAKLGCTHANSAIPCTDGDPCTASDKCTLGTCKGNPSPTPGCGMSILPLSSIDAGCNLTIEASCDQDESPVHPLDLFTFSLDNREVSNTQFVACVTAGKCSIPATSSSSCTYGKTGKDAFPVNCVTYDQALAYCKWAYSDGRLPTEAEWERAARATDARKYPWGNVEPDCTYADFTPASGACASGPKATGSYPAGKSAEGLFDLAGNVREWVADWYDAGYYASAPASNPTGPLSGTARGVRGGGYQSDAVGIRGGARSSSDPTVTSPSLGFRCARSGN